jgi:BarA-like signal transduction histidine kinase
MSKAVKKRISSMSFSLNRLYRAISMARPSGLIVPTIAIALAVFLLGGGLYDIIMKPLPAVYYGGRFIFLYPQLSEQFISDSIVAMIVYSLGIVGLITMYQSTKYIYKPRQAYMMLIIGVALLLLAYIFLEDTIRIKLSG